MSQSEVRLARRERPTGRRCARTIRIDRERFIETLVCDAPTVRIEVTIPAVVAVIVCPRCDRADR